MKIKQFFGIEEKFRLEWADLSALLTILNVTFIVLGYWWAPIIGLVNVGLNLVLTAGMKGHINLYVTNLALIVLNVYFLVAFR